MHATYWTDDCTPSSDEQGRKRHIPSGLAETHKHHENGRDDGRAMADDGPVGGRRVRKARICR